MSHHVSFIARLVSAAILVALAQAPPSAVAAPLIYEVFYDASGPDSGEVFTELFGDPGFVLDGWSLVGINGGTGLPYRTIDLTGAVFPADGLLVLAQDSSNPTLTPERDFVANVDWQNGPDAVQLIDPTGLIADALQFGDAGALNSGLGLPAVDAVAGSSLTRDSLATNTGNNFADFSMAVPSPGIGPSTGSAPPTSVPEPSTIVLLSLGVAATAAGRWCRSPAQRAHRLREGG